MTTPTPDTMTPGWRAAYAAGYEAGRTDGQGTHYDEPTDRPPTLTVAELRARLFAVDGNALVYAYFGEGLTIQAEPAGLEGVVVMRADIRTFGGPVR